MHAIKHPLVNILQDQRIRNTSKYSFEMQRKNRGWGI